MIRRPSPLAGRAGLLLLAICPCLTPAPLAAVPPPPPPMATIHGPNALCAARFGLRLANGETARQFMADFWVISAPGLELGIRTDLPGLEGRSSRVTMAGLGNGERQRVREWPGNRYRGWVYAFPIRDGATLRIASDQFQGTDADRPLLARVLVGAARERLCGHPS